MHLTVSKDPRGVSSRCCGYLSTESFFTILQGLFLMVEISFFFCSTCSISIASSSSESDSSSDELEEAEEVLGETQNKGHKVENLTGVRGKVLLRVGTATLAPKDPPLTWTQCLAVPWLGAMPARPLHAQNEAASSQDNEEAIASHHNSPDIVLWTMIQLWKHCLGLQIALEKCFSHLQREDMGRSSGLGQARFGRGRDLET